MSSTSIRTFSKAIIIFSFFITNVIFTQNNLEVKINGLQSGNDIIPEEQWSNPVIKNDRVFYVSFNTNNSTREQTFYRVFLDGVLINPRLAESFISLENLKTGTHILKIVPYIGTEAEGEALILPIKVEAAKPAVIQEVIEKEEVSFLANPLTLFVLIGIIAIQLAVILLLLKKKSGPAKPKEKTDESKNKLTELQHTYKRTQDDLVKLRSENELLKNTIQELNATVQGLENANMQLVQQKERLLESKNKLEVLQSQKEELFAIAIHDIKNPASAIRGYIELLNSYDLNAQEQQEILSSLVASSEEVVKLSQDMCTFIARAMPEPKLKFAPSSIKNVIDSICQQNLTYAKAKKVQLINKVGDNLPPVNIDIEKIGEALDNFVNNAIKYAPADTKVEMNSYVKDANKKMLVVEVVDNGVGLSEEDIKKAFQKGTILSTKPTGFEQSSGLGLWIVKRIIEEHDGKVWVKSKLGMGSTFAFELPLSE